MTCEHPECTDDVANSYTGPHDNELRLCEAHYYYLVAGERAPTDDRISTPSFEVPMPDVGPTGRQRREF
jgi:hypothetical protein